MPLTIEMEFSDRFEWKQMPRDHKPKKGEVLVETKNGYVRRESLGSGISSTTFNGDHRDVVARWQADRKAASKALLAEGKPPLDIKSDNLLIAEHLAAGMVRENSPGRMTALRVLDDADPQLEAFLRLYFSVGDANA